MLLLSVVAEPVADLKPMLMLLPVQVAAMAADPQAQPVASDDVDAVQWLQVHKLRSLDSKQPALQILHVCWFACLFSNIWSVCSCCSWTSQANDDG